ncbi:MAG: hypothetical protein WCT18_04165 [Patescibacteria group bacterium]
MTTVILLDGLKGGSSLVRPRFTIDEEVYLRGPLRRGVEVKGKVSKIHTSTSFNPNTRESETVITYSLWLETKDNDLRETVYSEKQLLCKVHYYIVMSQRSEGKEVDWEKF